MLNGKYLNVEGRSVYDPQQKNPKGEVHEELGMISFDKVASNSCLANFMLKVL